MSGRCQATQDTQDAGDATQDAQGAGDTEDATQDAQDAMARYLTQGNFLLMQLPLGKSQPPKSLWYGINSTSHPQQETLD